MLKHKSFRIVTISGAFFFAGIIVLYFIGQLTDFDHEICNYNPETKTQDCPPYKLLPFIGIEILKSLNDYSVVITTIATGFIAAFTGTLWVATKRLSEDSRRQIRVAIRAARAAEAATRTAGTQVELSREAMIKTERAFVTYRHTEWSWLKKRGTNAVIGWDFTVSWKNVGHTSTKFMTNCINRQIRIDAGPMPDDYTFPDAPDAIIGSAALARDCFVLSAPIRIATDVLEKVTTGNAVIYIYGWVDYNDVFIGTERHRTEFCFEIVVNGDPKIDDCGFGFKIFGPFNGHDGECYRKPQPYPS